MGKEDNSKKEKGWSTSNVRRNKGLQEGGEEEDGKESSRQCEPKWSRFLSLGNRGGPHIGSHRIGRVDWGKSATRPPVNQSENQTGKNETNINLITPGAWSYKLNPEPSIRNREVSGKIGCHREQREEDLYGGEKVKSRKASIWQQKKFN